MDEPQSSQLILSYNIISWLANIFELNWIINYSTVFDLYGYIKGYN